MALTFTTVSKGVFGDKAYWLGRITLDSSYPTGGESIAASDFDLNQIDGIFFQADKVDTTEGYVPLWDRSASKIFMIGGAGATTTEFDEVANTTDLSAIEITTLVLGESRNL